MDSARHQQLTGKGTERIHCNAALLVDRRANVQFRMPVIPGVNDDEGNLDQLAQFLRDPGVKALSLVEPTLKQVEPATLAEPGVLLRSGTGVP